MRTYSILLVMVFMLVGCGTTKEIQCPEPIVLYETIEVPIPVKLPRPVIECDFNVEDVEGALLDCIILQKKVIEELTIEPIKENKK